MPKRATDGALLDELVSASASVASYPHAAIAQPTIAGAPRPSPFAGRAPGVLEIASWAFPLQAPQDDRGAVSCPTQALVRPRSPRMALGSGKQPHYDLGSNLRLPSAADA